MSKHHFPTLKSVALKAGVSTATASFVLNGKSVGQRISTETQQRVRRAADELQYQPNPLARNLRRQKSNTLGVLWGFSGPHLSNSLVQCFTTTAMELGYSALVYDTVGTFTIIKTQLQQLLNWRVQGVIMLCQGTVVEQPDPEILEMLKRFPHTLLVVEELLDWPFPQIVQSRRKAMADAVRYLVEGGCRHLAYLGTISSTRTKVSAIQSALTKFPTTSDLLILDHPQSTSLDPALINPLLDEAVAKGVDGLFTTTDEMAALAIVGLRAREKRVPEDVAVVGFNDSLFAPLFAPPIASVRRLDAEVCTFATQHLIEICKNPDLKKQPAKKFEMEFIPRVSAGIGQKKKSQASRPPRQIASGFSLIETLVVIVIILLLAAVVSPTVQAIHKRSVAARCVSNLRQIGMAMAQYAADNQNCLPLNVYPGNSWHTKVDSYLGCDYRKIWDKPELVYGSPLFCPDEKKRPLTSPYATYAINRELYPREGYDNPPKEIAALANPSKYVVMSDGHDAVIYTDSNQKMVEWTQITRYHDGHPNFLYADWHVENFSGPIVGLMDPDGQLPENRMRWEARYVTP